MATRRTRPVPDSRVTIHVIGELGHYFAPSGEAYQLPSWRTAALAADLRHPGVPRVAATIQIGNQTSDATFADWDTYDTGLRRRLGSRAGAVLTLPGPEDVPTVIETARGVSQGLARLNRSNPPEATRISTANRVLGYTLREGRGSGRVDLIRVLGLYVDDPAVAGGTVTAGHLAQLTAEIGAHAPLPVVIACNYPLVGTYRDSISNHYAARSDEGADVARLATGDGLGGRALLDALLEHTNVVAWISGGTASWLSPGRVVRLLRAGKPGGLVHVAAPSPYVHNRTSYAVATTPTTLQEQRVLSTFVTLDGDTVQVRLRDHVAGCWVPGRGRTVHRLRRRGDLLRPEYPPPPPDPARVIVEDQ